ncbi:MAG: recombinase RmuC [Acidithiobacillales bacterium SG8_45]|jgi:DNA recombination protein RmuC|nr:MAG: recombinase RmuC [Acidithiobacillales bacterium SG8_45]
MAELSNNMILLLGIVAAVAAFIGWLIGHMLNQRKVTQLETRLEMERVSAEGKLSELETTFHSLSTKALHANNQAFIQLAEQTLKRLHTEAKGQLDQKEKAVENLIKPIKEALEKTESQIHSIEKERKEAYGSLRQYLDSMIKTQELLQGETRNLVQALRRPEVRGQWGELTLKRLAELAGMVQHCDFFEQEATADRSMRPDMIVRMPDRREIVVDAKTPLDAYLSAVEARDDVERKAFLERHAANVRKRVRELASKGYWNQFNNAPDFVILFIPGDQFLSAALDQDPKLLEDALQQQIVLTTPTSLVALLRAVAYGWRQEALAANADKIREVGVDLYRRLSVFADHLAKLGRSLDGAVGNFNKAVGSFEAKVMPGARKFTELGVETQPLEPPVQIEKGLRQPTNQEGEDK